MAEAADKVKPYVLSYRDTLKNISNALGVNLNELLSDNELTSTSDMPKKLSPEVETIAAHLEGKDITPKKMKLIKNYID